MVLIMVKNRRDPKNGRGRVPEDKLPKKVRDRLSDTQKRVSSDVIIGNILESLKGMPEKRLLLLLCEAIAEQARSGQPASLAIKELLEKAEDVEKGKEV